MDDQQAEFLRNLFTPDPEDQPHAGPEQIDPQPATIADFLKTIFTN